MSPVRVVVHVPVIRLGVESVNFFQGFVGVVELEAVANLLAAPEGSLDCAISNIGQLCLVFTILHFVIQVVACTRAFSNLDGPVRTLREVFR